MAYELYLRTRALGVSTSVLDIVHKLWQYGRAGNGKVSNKNQNTGFHDS